MHHFKIPIYQKQDIFVAKQHISNKTPFQTLKQGFSLGKSTQFLALIPLAREIIAFSTWNWLGFYRLIFGKLAQSHDAEHATPINKPAEAGLFITKKHLFSSSVN